MKILNNVSVTDQQFAFLADLIRRSTGIVITDAKRGLLTARLNRRLRHLGFSSYDEYCLFLRSPDGVAEHQEIISSITTNVTAFFRESHHFDALRLRVLPPLLNAAKRGERIRIWSCACSTGEEVYSIALTVLSLERSAEKLDVLVLGTDIDPLVVEKAETGIYDASVEKQIPDEHLIHFDQTSDGRVVVKDYVKKIIRFAPLNLHEAWPFSGRFDVIFCRNVVIYFDTGDRRRLWTRLGDQLKSGGSLFIGHSERLDGEASSVFKLAGNTQYVKV